MKNHMTGMFWLRARMDHLGYESLDAVALKVGINRGNLFRYFTLETVPSMALLPDLCRVLDVSPEELLRALEIIGSRDRI
jgi:transcriptional regulator with XRE-family HTH domain